MHKFKNLDLSLAARKNNSEFYNEHKTAQEQLRKKFAIIFFQKKYFLIFPLFSNKLYMFSKNKINTYCSSSVFFAFALRCRYNALSFMTVSDRFSTVLTVYFFLLTLFCTFHLFKAPFGKSNGIDSYHSDFIYHSLQF